MADKYKFKFSLKDYDEIIKKLKSMGYPVNLVGSLYFSRSK
jgi:hypothetical protein